MLHLTVNGEPQTVPDGLTVADLVWGCTLCAIGASVMWLTERWLGK